MPDKVEKVNFGQIGPPLLLLTSDTISQAFFQLRPAHTAPVDVY